MPEEQIEQVEAAPLPPGTAELQKEIDAAKPETAAPTPKPREAEEPELTSAQQRAFDKRLGKELAKIRKSDPVRAEADYWKAKALEAGVAPLSDDLPFEEWTRRRNVQRENGGVPTEQETDKAPASSAAKPEKAEQSQPAAESQHFHEWLMEGGVPEEHAVRHAQQIEEARAWYPDFGQIAAAAERMPITEGLRQEIIALDNSADVTVALIRNPDLFESLGHLPPNVAKAKLREMSTFLKGQEQEDQEPIETDIPKPVTQPIRPVRKAAPTATGLSDDLPYSVRVKRRNAQRARRS
jgi:hypothetical protein